MKAYTPNGYKQISCMCFGEAAIKINSIRPGTIIAVINPRLMPKQKDQAADKNGHTFCIDSEA